MKFLAVATPLLFIAGCVGGGWLGAARSSAGSVYARLPHHVPPSPDSAPFRFAMVHDVIHERYARHGPAFYRERERLARERLAVLHPASEAALGLTDDIAVGLDRTGRTDEAVALLRDKLGRQKAAGLAGKDLYSSYANLGEFLVRGSLTAMLAGDPAARGSVAEGRDLLQRSLAVNPGAHFGREEWQLVAIDTLLEAGERPAVLRRCDLIGNRLDRPIDIRAGDWRVVPRAESEAIHGRPYTEEFIYTVHLRPRDYALAIHDPDRRTEAREYICPVGRERPPDGVVDDRRGRRAPFDEPALWLVGEWRQGAGPAPHLALCLGEIMIRVGQRYLAWDCYERAVRLADGYSPRADQRRALLDHCRARQQTIERSLPRAEADGLRPRFEAELALGEAYQRAYQEYEERQIAEGADLNGPHFFDAFHAGRPSIASPVGAEEWYAGRRTGPTDAWIAAFCQWGLLTGGVCVLLLALAVHGPGRGRPHPSARVIRRP